MKGVSKMDLKLVMIVVSVHVIVESFIIELPMTNEGMDNEDVLKADTKAAIFRTRSNAAHLKVDESQRKTETKSTFPWAKNWGLVSEKESPEDIIAFVIKRGASDKVISTRQRTDPVARKAFSLTNPSRSRRETSTSIYENPDVQNVLKEYMKIKSSSGVVFYIPRWG